MEAIGAEEEMARIGYGQEHVGLTPGDGAAEVFEIFLHIDPLHHPFGGKDRGNPQESLFHISQKRTHMRDDKTDVRKARHPIVCVFAAMFKTTRAVSAGHS